MQMDASGDGELQQDELLEAPEAIRDRLGEILGLGSHISDENMGRYVEEVARLQNDCNVFHEQYWISMEEMKSVHRVS